MSAARVVPCTIGEARAFVERHDGHHHALPGGGFAVAVVGRGRVCCAAVVGRPVARALGASPALAEGTRVASNRTCHAASMGLAAAARGALAIGSRRLVSYTILAEAGTSCLAACRAPLARSAMREVQHRAERQGRVDARAQAAARIGDLTRARGSTRPSSPRSRPSRPREGSRLRS